MGGGVIVDTVPFLATTFIVGDGVDMVTIVGDKGAGAGVGVLSCVIIGLGSKALGVIGLPLRPPPLPLLLALALINRDDDNEESLLAALWLPLRAEDMRYLGIVGRVCMVGSRVGVF